MCRWNRIRAICPTCLRLQPNPNDDLIVTPEQIEVCDQAVRTQWICRQDHTDAGPNHVNVMSWRSCQFCRYNDAKGILSSSLEGGNRELTTWAENLDREGNNPGRRPHQARGTQGDLLHALGRRLFFNSRQATGGTARIDAHQDELALNPDPPLGQEAAYLRNIYARPMLRDDVADLLPASPYTLETRRINYLARQQNLDRTVREYAYRLRALLWARMPAGEDDRLLSIACLLIASGDLDNERTFEDFSRMTHRDRRVLRDTVDTINEFISADVRERLRPSGNSSTRQSPLQPQHERRMTPDVTRPQGLRQRNEIAQNASHSPRRSGTQLEQSYGETEESDMGNIDIYNLGNLERIDSHVSPPHNPRRSVPSTRSPEYAPTSPRYGDRSPTDHNPRSPPYNASDSQGPVNHAPSGAGNDPSRDAGCIQNRQLRRSSLISPAPRPPIEHPINLDDYLDEDDLAMGYADTRYDGRGDPSPIVSVQERRTRGHHLRDPSIYILQDTARSNRHATNDDGSAQDKENLPQQQEEDLPEQIVDETDMENDEESNWGNGHEQPINEAVIAEVTDSESEGEQSNSDEETDEENDEGNDHEQPVNEAVIIEIIDSESEEEQSGIDEEDNSDDSDSEDPSEDYINVAAPPVSRRPGLRSRPSNKRPAENSDSDESQQPPQKKTRGATVRRGQGVARGQRGRGARGGNPRGRERGRGRGRGRGK